MWKPSRQPDAVVFDFGRRTDVLSAYDVASTFVFEDELGSPYLAHWADEADDDSADSYIVVPTDTATIGSLRAGRVTLCVALNRTLMWLVIKQREGGGVEAYRTTFNDLPVDLLPAVTVRLAEPRLGACGEGTS